MAIKRETLEANRIKQLEKKVSDLQNLLWMCNLPINYAIHALEIAIPTIEDADKKGSLEGNLRVMKHLLEEVEQYGKSEVQHDE